MNQTNSRGDSSRIRNISRGKAGAAVVATRTTKPNNRRDFQICCVREERQSEEKAWMVQRLCTHLYISLSASLFLWNVYFCSAWVYRILARLQLSRHSCLARGGLQSMGSRRVRQDRASKQSRERWVMTKEYLLLSRDRFAAGTRMSAEDNAQLHIWELGLIQRTFWGLQTRDTVSQIMLSKLFQRGKGDRKSEYLGAFASSGNIKRLLLIKENHTSQIKEFSPF